MQILGGNQRALLVATVGDQSLRLIIMILLHTACGSSTQRNIRQCLTDTLPNSPHARAMYNVTVLALQNPCCMPELPS